MKKKKSFLIVAASSFVRRNLMSILGNYKITNGLNKILLVILLLYTSNGYCCINCNKKIQEAINNSIYTNIFIMFSAFIALTIVILLLVFLATKHYHRKLNPNTNLYQLPSLPLIYPAMILGIGIGGFIDGIVLHQILQWHEMLSNKFPPNTLIQKSMNMFWDGIFHLFTLLSTIVGVYLLWKLLKKNNINTSGYLLSGGMLAGWGVFNLIEGIINHQILQMHNVREITANKDLWNYGFLLFGIALLLVGWLIIRKGKNSDVDPV